MHQMKLAEILVNPSVEPEDELRLSRQAMIIYRRLCNKVLPPPSNVELMDLSHSRNFTARLSEVRQALQDKYGVTVKIVKKAKDGVNFYAIEE